MATASRKTIIQTLEVARRYLTETQIRDVLRGLRAVKGNRCYRLTISDLCDLVKLDPKVEQGATPPESEGNDAGDDVS